MGWLDAAHIPSMIIGGVAASVLGRPRLTRDVDALAVLPEQLNRTGRDGRNQLVSLSEAGYIRRAGNDGKPLPPFDAASAARERKIADPTDARQPLEARARSYLHANCGHCHFEHGGGSVPLRLQFSVAAVEMMAIARRPKDIEDLKGLLAAHPDADVARARRWVREFATAMSTPDMLQEFEALLSERTLKR